MVRRRWSNTKVVRPDKEILNHNKPTNSSKCKGSSNNNETNNIKKMMKMMSQENTKMKILLKLKEGGGKKRKLKGSGRHKKEPLCKNKWQQKVHLKWVKS